MNIVIVGTGYVGLVTGVGLAELGNTVSFIDLDTEKIKKLKNKELPFFEPDLDKYFSKIENFERMSFHSNYEDLNCCLLYTSPSPRDAQLSRMPSSA